MSSLIVVCGLLQVIDLKIFAEMFNGSTTFNDSTLPNRTHLINIDSSEMVNGITCTLPDRAYLINIGLIVTLVIQITSAVVYQLLSMTTRSAKRGVGGAVTESLSFGTCLVYYSIFLILKLINPSTYPVHWVILTGIQHYYY